VRKNERHHFCSLNTAAGDCNRWRSVKLFEPRRTRSPTPWLVEFQDKYKAQGLQVIGVEMYGSSAEATQRFASEFGVKYPLLLGNDDVGNLDGVGALPTNYYIGRDRRLVQATEGAKSKADIESFILAALK
jgi:hypothetical protein